MTWAVRIGLFVVPVMAYVITKRWALGLQRSDREKVLHGRETGVIKRMPNGEFVEVHEPLSQEQLHALVQHEQYKPIGPGAVDGAGDLNAVFRLAQHLRARLSDRLYGEGTQIAKPTAQEYKEITDKHRN
ncbi:hypothetical protein M2283_000150 [Streptomyces pseudovenezuelae]|uniref:Uncharacterized protein n=1 Tax=Streptomyces pseudovenezuelae TaxID=67350 RepID=A0ABT6L971_9ACTN|nr:hypothetical protein [Streptomyces pseudovenezuelae]